jgi:carbon-monoxide dehydrogenase medium subunit
MRDFKYHRPADVKTAAATLKSAGEGKLLAGGMTLLPVLKQRLAAPTDLIDLSAIPELQGIRLDGKELVIGAMTPHAVVAASADVRKAVPTLAELADGIADPAVRNRGTLGGSIANADPAADYPAAVLGLDAVVETTERRIPADQFFTGLYSTALNPGEIVTAVRFKTPERARYMKFRHPASGFAVVGVMVAKFANAVRVAVTGAGPSVFRVSAMEAALARSFKADAIAAITIPPDELMSDIHYSAEYRAHLTGVLARRAVAELTRA